MLDKEALMSQRRGAVGMPTVEHEHRWSLTHDAVFNRSPLRLSNGSHRLSSFNGQDGLAGLSPSKIIVTSLPDEASLCLLRVGADDIVPQDKEGRRPPRIVERKRDMVQWRKASCSSHTFWSAGKPGRQVPVFLCARRRHASLTSFAHVSRNARQIPRGVLQWKGGRRREVPGGCLEQRQESPKHASWRE